MVLTPEQTKALSAFLNRIEAVPAELVAFVEDLKAEVQTLEQDAVSVVEADTTAPVETIPAQTDTTETVSALSGNAEEHADGGTSNDELAPKSGDVLTA